MRQFIAGGGGQLLPLDFTNLANGSLSFADAGATRADELNVYGTAASDVFTVNAAGTVSLLTQDGLGNIEAWFP